MCYTDHEQRTNNDRIYLSRRRHVQERQLIKEANKCIAAEKLAKMDYVNGVCLADPLAPRPKSGGVWWVWYAAS